MGDVAGLREPVQRCEALANPVFLSLFFIPSWLAPVDRLWKLTAKVEACDVEGPQREALEGGDYAKHATDIGRDVS